MAVSFLLYLFEIRSTDTKEGKLALKALANTNFNGRKTDFRNIYSQEDSETVGKILTEYYHASNSGIPLKKYIKQKQQSPGSEDIPLD